MGAQTTCADRASWLIMMLVRCRPLPPGCTPHAMGLLCARSDGGPRRKEIPDRQQVHTVCLGGCNFMRTHTSTTHEPPSLCNDAPHRRWVQSAARVCFGCIVFLLPLGDYAAAAVTRVKYERMHVCDCHSCSHSPWCGP